MDNNGHARHGGLINVFVDLVPPELLETINACIDATRNEWKPADGRRASVTARSFAEQLRQNERFEAMEAQVCAAARRWATTVLKKEVTDEPLHVLRCVGPGAASQSYLRHFDSHVLTVLVPLQLARDGDRNGDLVLHVRQRKTISPLANLLTKSGLFFEHGLPFFIRRMLVAPDLSNGRCERIPCSVGNVYVFNGFVTLHHNLDVAAGERRTLIIHHFDAGLTSGARSIMRSFRGLRDRLADLY
jgi:hypothetical protein